MSFRLVTRRGSGKLLRVRFLSRGNVTYSHLRLAPSKLFHTGKNTQFNGLLGCRPNGACGMRIRLSITGHVMVICISKGGIKRHVFFTPIPTVREIVFQAKTRQACPAISAPTS